MKVYVVIVIYNGLKWIDRCFGSLRQSVLPVTVIAIDNGSTDGSVEKIRADFPEVQLMEAESNLGFGKANNMGMELAEKAGADYIFLFNQDAWIEGDTLQGLVTVAASNKDFGIISPIHLNGSYTGLDINFSNYIAPDKCEGLVSDMFIRQLKPVYDLEFVNAAAWLVSMACYRKVGGFEPLFFFYGEDWNYCQRVRAHNFKIGVAPAYTICHDREVRKGKLNPTPDKLRERTMSLSVLLDITNGWTSRVLLFTRIRLVGLLASTLRLKPVSAGYHLREICYLLTHYSKIKSIRRGYKE
ncbi:glycosyltransferase family 2 protein [Chitinophaga silvisoli]|uniref:Glycosyltransferase family 2 protein n=1 Tax=Chitinophaga silvisoli TaxID=2291814 RepID=A0A3E1P6P7_9BACT|nr:glycosyltransferase family 2 protein [Chitinophaga silvisoli]RFM35842.1 glycosyltransferase family 2 protein [Chitinophaga silvisoli]